MRYLLILLILTSCSAEWHLRQAIKKNPKYSDSTYKTIITEKVKTIFIYDTIPGDSGVQYTTHLVDSLRKVYNDSFTTVYQIIDKLGKVKTTVVRKPIYIHDSVEIVIRDTIQLSCPEIIKVEEGYPKWYLWLFVAIFVGIFIFKIVK
jgi:hypothetical protein